MTATGITGIILAGGKNSRMGIDKGLIILNGKRFIEHILEALTPIVTNIMIITTNTNYKNYGYPIYEDIIKDCGPIGGIYTGLVNSTTITNFILSCDIPFITSEMLAYIISHSEDAEITVPKYEEKLEPLCGVYKKTCEEKFRELIEKKEWKMQEALTHFKTNELNFLGTNDVKKNFINFNTPQELNEHKNK